MKREEIESFLDESLSLAPKEGVDISPFNLGNAGVGGYGVQTVSPGLVTSPPFMTKLYQFWDAIVQKVIDIRNSDMSGLYITGHDLIKMACLGVETARNMFAGRWHQDYRSNLQLGCRRRSNSGKRFICRDVRSNFSKEIGAESYKWMPTTLPMEFTPWRKIIYDSLKVKFNANNMRREIMQVDGANQFFRITDLDDFLKVKRFETKARMDRTLRELGMPPFGLVTPSHVMSSVLNIPSSQAKDYATPRGLTAKVLAEDENGGSQEFFSQTLSYVGAAFDVPMIDARTGAKKGISGSYGFLYPEQISEWDRMLTREEYLRSRFSNGDLSDKDLQEMYSLQNALIALAQSSMHIGYLSPVDFSQILLANRIPLYSCEVSSNTVFLKKGKSYRLSLELDNIYTPMTLEKIPTVQSNLEYKTLKVSV